MIGHWISPWLPFKQLCCSLFFLALYDGVEQSLVDGLDERRLIAGSTVLGEGTDQGDHLHLGWINLRVICFFLQLPCFLFILVNCSGYLSPRLAFEAIVFSSQEFLEVFSRGVRFQRPQYTVKLIIFIVQSGLILDLGLNLEILVVLVHHVLHLLNVFLHLGGDILLLFSHLCFKSLQLLDHLHSDSSLVLLCIPCLFFGVVTIECLIVGTLSALNTPSVEEPNLAV